LLPQIPGRQHRLPFVGLMYPTPSVGGLGSNSSIHSYAPPKQMSLAEADESGRPTPTVEVPDALTDCRGWPADACAPKRWGPLTATSPATSAASGPTYRTTRTALIQQGPPTAPGRFRSWPNSAGMGLSPCLRVARKSSTSCTHPS